VTLFLDALITGGSLPLPCALLGPLCLGSLTRSGMGDERDPAWESPRGPGERSSTWARARKASAIVGSKIEGRVDGPRLGGMQVRYEHRLHWAST
jgi:hypothetical protein